MCRPNYKVPDEYERAALGSWSYSGPAREALSVGTFWGGGGVGQLAFSLHPWPLTLVVLVLGAWVLLVDGQGVPKSGSMCYCVAVIYRPPPPLSPTLPI